MNPQNKISSYHSLFFDDDYVSDPVIVDFDKPPIFDEEYVTEPVIVDFDKPSVFDEDLFQNEQHERDSIFEDYFYDVAMFHHSTASPTYLFLKTVKIRGRIFSNLKRMMQQQLRQWNTWSGWRIRILVAWTNQIRAELHGPLQRAYGLGSSIIICFRKAQDEPYICYEDYVMKTPSSVTDHNRPKFGHLDYCAKRDESWTR